MAVPHQDFAWQSHWSC